jgi:hypothetical protein
MHVNAIRILTMVTVVNFLRSSKILQVSILFFHLRDGPSPLVKMFNL